MGRIDSIESGSVRVKFTITGADASALRAKLKAKVDAGGITAVGPIQAKPIGMVLHDASPGSKASGTTNAPITHGPVPNLFWPNVYPPSELKTPHEPSYAQWSWWWYIAKALQWGPTISYTMHEPILSMDAQHSK